MKLRYHCSFFLIYGLLCYALVSCGSTSKTARQVEDAKRLEELVSEKSFEIVSDWAFPMATNAMNSIANAGLFPPGSSAGRVNLIGNSNFVRVMGDSVSLYLPYFGERQMGGGYDNDGAGIQFEGFPETLEITENEDKNRREILLRVNDDSELFILNIVLYANLTSTINVNSTQRFPIRYSGEVGPLPENL